MTGENTCSSLLAEIRTHQQQVQFLPSLRDPWSLIEHLHRMSSLQARAGAIVGEAALLKGQLEAEFIETHREDFDKLPPTKFSMLMNAELHRCRALCIAADRLESDITHMCDNLRTEISYLKAEAVLAPRQTT